MADRIIENQTEDIPAMPEGLQRVLMEALEQGKADLEGGYDIVPFTMLVAGDNLFTERHPGDTTEECYASARHAVEGARGALAYALCYDGYLDTDEGMKDAVIAEGGAPGEETGYAIGYVYTVNGDGRPEFASAPSYIGKAPNFMEGLKDEPAGDEGEAEGEGVEDGGAAGLDVAEAIEADTN